MRNIVLNLGVLCVAAAITSACSSTSPAPKPSTSIASVAPASLTKEELALVSPEVLRIHLACLTGYKITQQIEACTSAINSGALPPKMLASTLTVRGALYLRQLRVMDAQIDLEEAKRLDPGNVVLEKALASLATAKGKASPAQIGELQAIVDCRDSLEPSVRQAACDRLVAESAGTSARQAIALDVRAFARLRQRDADGALDDLDRAITLSPQNAELKEHRYAALFMAQRYREALPGLETMLARDPYNSALKTMVATIYYVEDDKLRALAAFEEMRY